MRRAISPRLATRTERNISQLDLDRPWRSIVVGRRHDVGGGDAPGTVDRLPPKLEGRAARDTVQRELYDAVRADLGARHDSRAFPGPAEIDVRRVDCRPLPRDGIARERVAVAGQERAS